MRSRFVVAIVILVFARGVRAHVPACDVVRAKLRGLETNITLYAVRHGEYPPSKEWFERLQADGLVDELARTDPWGNSIEYRLEADGGFELMSVGSDGKLGTKDDQVRRNGWAWDSCADPDGCRGCEL